MFHMKRRKENMITTKEEIMNRLNSVIGGRTDDDAIHLIEDVTDTLGDLETRTTETDKYKNLYDEQVKKYKDRFFITDTKSGGNQTPEAVKKEETEDVQEDDKPKDFDSLFAPKEKESEVV